MSYNVAGRLPELGIRAALGAQRWQVIKMVMLESSSMILVGAGVGVAASYLAAHLVTTLVYGLDANDPATIAGALVLLLSTAAVAAFLPARQAARADPLVALRHE